MVDSKLQNLRPSGLTDQEIQRCAWVVIHSVLSCVPVEVGLATYLQNKFHVLEEYAERAVGDGHGLLVIQSYIEVIFVSHCGYEQPLTFRIRNAKLLLQN